MTFQFQTGIHCFDSDASMPHQPVTSCLELHTINPSVWREQYLSWLNLNLHVIMHTCWYWAELWMFGVLWIKFRRNTMPVWLLSFKIHATVLLVVILFLYCYHSTMGTFTVTQLMILIDVYSNYSKTLFIYLFTILFFSIMSNVYSLRYYYDWSHKFAHTSLL